MLTFSEQLYNMSDMNAIHRLIAKRDALIDRLSDYKYILRGTIIQRGNICGKSGCRCKKKQASLLHGPYKYLSHRSRQGSNMIFLNKTKLLYAGHGIRQYKELIELIYRISEINFEVLRYHYAELSNEV